jgi:hypothetical protein
VTRNVVVDARGARLGIGDRMPGGVGVPRARNATREAYEIWDRHRTASRLPRLDDFFPHQLGSLLACTLVVQVLRDPPDYRYIFVGDMEAEARGYDPTGKTVREVFADEPEVLDFCLGNYIAATSSPDGFIDFSIDATPNDRYLEMETLFLPCAEDGKTVTEVVVYSHYVDQPKIPAEIQ